MSYLEELNRSHVERRARIMGVDNEARAELQSERRKSASLAYQVDTLKKDLLLTSDLLTQERNRNRRLAAELDVVKKLKGMETPAEPIDKDTYGVQRILRLVSQAHGVSMGDLIGPGRVQKHVRARFHAVWLLKTHRPDLSTTSIGHHMGGKDHCSIIRALERWPKKLPKCTRQVEEVNRILGAVDSADKGDKTNT